MRLESLADAIANINQYNSPESAAYSLRNPGMIPARKEQPHNEDGVRTFSCHRAGYQALLDVLVKRTGNYPNEPLTQTLKIFGVSYDKQKIEALDFIGRALNTNEVSQDTTLSFFLEK
jgi:hypothetical protein